MRRQIDVSNRDCLLYLLVAGWKGIANGSAPPALLDLVLILEGQLSNDQIEPESSARGSCKQSSGAFDQRMCSLATTELRCPKKLGR